MPDLLEGGLGFLGSGWGCAGWRWRRRWSPGQWAFRYLSSISLLSAEDMGRGSRHDQCLGKQVGPCCLAHAGGPREAFLLWPCFSAVARGARACPATGLCWVAPPSCPQKPSLSQLLLQSRSQA